MPRGINRCLHTLYRSYLLPIDRTEEHRQRLITLAVAIRVHFQLPFETTNLKHITATKAQASVRSSLLMILSRPCPSTAHRSANAQQRHQGVCGNPKVSAATSLHFRQPARRLRKSPRHSPRRAAVLRPRVGRLWRRLARGGERNGGQGRRPNLNWRILLMSASESLSAGAAGSATVQVNCP